MTESTNPPTPERVECSAAKDPAIRKLIMSALLLGFGLYCFYEAYILDLYPYPSGSGNINELMGWAFNRVLGPFVFIPAGLAILAWTIWSLRLKLVADSEGIGYEGGRKTSWDQITELDASRIEKGWLFLHVGTDRKITLDSWKLQNFKQLVAFVESVIPDDIIKR